MLFTKHDQRSQKHGRTQMKVDAVEPKSLFETRRDKEDFSIYVLLISKKVDF